MSREYTSGKIFSVAKKRILYLILLFLSLPLIIWAQAQILSYLSKAAPQKANIVVDTTSAEGNFSGNWLNFAQGGEEPPPMLRNTVERMKLLQPQYIRIDHIYDYYDVVKDDGSFDFSMLDNTVDDILKTGAKPFFSLSYMPKQFTESSSVIDMPKDWNLWQNLVKATIEHYSGKNHKNIKNVYYEVWNEPELPQFGGWKLTGDKNYNLLYEYASDGAKAAENTNKFFFGGPAAGSFYSEWVDKFISNVNDNNLRLDFYSWHRYHKNSDKFAEDALNIRKILNKYPQFANLPLVLSEWGMDSENNLNNNSDKSAAHALSTILKTYDVIDKSFVFEIKDGPPPGGGNWGLMTHEKNIIPLNLKPRFKAFSATTYLLNAKLSVRGTNNNIVALAGKSPSGIIYILITNYEANDKNWENVPLTLTGLSSGLYKITSHNLNTNSTTANELSSTDGSIKQEILMLPNSSYLLEIKKSGKIAQYVSGATGETNDKALVLSNENDFNLSPADFNVPDNFEISFDAKPFWSQSPGQSIDILKLNMQNSDNKETTVILSKTSSKNIDFLVLTIKDLLNEERLAMPINLADKNAWHHINIVSLGGKIILSIDGNIQGAGSKLISDISKLTGIYFYPFSGALDNLEIKNSGQILYKQTFD